MRLGPDLAAAVPFYGGQPNAADTAKIKAPVMAHYGELDTRITSGWPAFDAALTAASRMRALSTQNANHGFHNDTTPALRRGCRQARLETHAGLVQPLLADMISSLSNI